MEVPPCRADFLVNGSRGGPLFDRHSGRPGAVGPAEALDGLDLDVFEEDQQARLARAVALSADELRFMIERGRLELSDGEAFREALALLEMRMHDLLDDSTDNQV